LLGVTAEGNKYVTTLSLTGFTQRNFVEDFLQAKCPLVGA